MQVRFGASHLAHRRRSSSSVFEQSTTFWITAYELLDDAGLEELGSGRGALLFDRTDIDRCREFQSALKERFAKDLRVLGVKGPQTPDIPARETAVSSKPD